MCGIEVVIDWGGGSGSQVCKDGWREEVRKEVRDGGKEGCREGRREEVRKEARDGGKEGGREVGNGPWYKGLKCTQGVLSIQVFLFHSS